MRLAILDHGHGIRTKAMLVLIRAFSGHPVVDAVKLALYRPSFYRAGALTQEAMRGPSDWSVADRELMAAYISKMNETEFCVAAHTATSVLACAKVSATLADLETAPLGEPLRATLRMLGKLTRESNVDAGRLAPIPRRAGRRGERERKAVFILTHHPRDPVEMEGGTTFHFVTDGIESALEQAKKAAGGKDVMLWGGANIAQQYLAAGLLDEHELHVVPVLLGDGARFFDNLGDAEVQLGRSGPSRRPASRTSSTEW